MFEALARIRSQAVLLAPAGRGTARLLIDRIKTTPRRAALGAALSAVVVGIGGNALLMQMGRHPAPLFASAARDSEPGPVAVPAAARVEAAPPPISASPASTDNPASAAPSPAGGASRASQPPAPDTTASIPRATPDKAPQASAPSSAAPGSDHGERPPAAPPDQIGDLLRGKAVGDGSQLVRSAQIALAKLGYPVKPGGAEDGATRRAIRKFERAHGLALTTEISPELVKELNEAAGAAR